MGRIGATAHKEIVKDLSIFLQLIFSFVENKASQSNVSFSAYPGRCINVYTECPEWKKNGLCEQNREYMTTTCPVTCGFCEGDYLLN